MNKLKKVINKKDDMLAQNILERRGIRFIKNQNTLLIIIIIAISVIASFINPNFLTYRNISNILQQVSVLGIATMCMGLLMLAGQLDLSIGAMMGLVGVIFVKMVKAGVSVELSVLAVLAIAAFCGFVNGIIVAKSKVMPLIITLGMLYVYYGLALYISDGRPNALGDYFRFLGQSKLGPENFSIPFTIIVFLLIFLLAFAMNKYTKYGRRLNAIGGNRLTAYLAGINVDMHIISLYVLVGLIMGLAGLVLASRLGNVRAGSGDGYELKALAAVIIGGITFEGGKGSLIGAFFGVVLLGVIYNAMNIVGVSSYFQTMVLGAIIVITTVISNIGKTRKA